MQIIQTIRDKGAAIVIAVIALSLIGFILMDAKQGGNNFFSSLSGSIGKVNGSAIEKTEFERKIKFADNMARQQAQQSGRPAPDAAQIREQVWNQIVAEKVFYDEAQKLGIKFTSPELSAILKSNDPSNPLMQDQSMVDPSTGRLDESKVTSAINTIKKAKGEQYEMINAQIAEPQKLASVSGKYFAMLNASAYYPKWMKEKDSVEAKGFANISYVSIPYNVISDSTVKVTDGEIDNYIQKHKKQFKQEEGRMISYVTFSQLPSADDSAKTKELVAGLKEGLATDPNTKAFVARNTSLIEFDSNYLPKAKIRSSYIDTIAKQPVGSVYGPYVDGGAYIIAKMLGTKQMPDSIKCRHILVKIADKNGQMREDSVARKLIDSIAAAVKTGADFNALVLKYSDDEGSRNNKGEYKFSSSSTLVDSFYNAVFYNPTGTKKIVKGQSQDYIGYHYVEVLDQWKFAPAYKVAFLAKEILPSDATIQNASLNATKLSAQKNAKELEAYIVKNGLQRISLPTIIKENDFSIGDLQDARLLVRWVFEAKKGDVSEPFNIGEKFVVATVDKIQSEGTQDATTARPMVEGVIRNEKKAEAIIKKLGTATTLEAAAAAYSKQIEIAGADSSLTFSSQMIANIGDEPKLIGASFNKENQAKASAPIAGNSGVYVIKVNSISTKSIDTPAAATQKLSTLRSQVGAGWFEGLKNQATIKDNRSKYY